MCARRHRGDAVFFLTPPPAMETVGESVAVFLSIEIRNGNGGIHPT